MRRFLRPLTAAVALSLMALMAALPLLARGEPPAPAGELVEPLGSGRVNWTGGYLEATGSGAARGDEPTAAVARLRATRAARADALRNLLESLQGVRVSGETVVENLMTTSDTIRVQVEGVVRGAVERERSFDGQVATLTLRVPLWGTLAQSLYGAPGLFGPGAAAPPLPQRPAAPEPPPGPGPGLRGWLDAHPTLKRLARLLLPARAWAAETAGEPTGEPQPSPQVREELRKTGLILDLTATRAKPDLFPRIIDAATGRPLVDASRVGAAAAARGTIGYAPSVEAARRQVGRVGEDPLVIKALNFLAGTGEGFKVDLAAGMTLDTAEQMLADPEGILKQGIAVAYRIAW